MVALSGSDILLENIGNVKFMQKMNRVKVLEHIRKNSPVSRYELSNVSGLSLSSITNIVNYLIDAGLVSETDRIAARGAGRKAVRLEFNSSAIQVVAVNIEADEATVSVADLGGGILESRKFPISGEKSPESVIVGTLEIVKDFIAKRKAVKAIGFTVSGHVSGNGVVSSSVLGWDNVEIKTRFENETGLPVYIANNTNTKALWTIRALNDEKHKNIVFLDMTADGIGIANAYNGSLNEAVAGELGHTVVAGVGNSAGYLEKVCSVKKIVDSYFNLSGKKLSFSEIRKNAKAGDTFARQGIEEACRYMSVAILNIIMIFEPDFIIVNASELFEVEEMYEAAVSEAVLDSSRLAMKKPDFRRVNLAPEQAVQGAAQFVADNILGINGPDELL